MARTKNEESDELDDDDFDYEDDEEFEDYEDDETEDDEEDDDLLSNPTYKSIYQKAKEDAEKAVLEALVSEDTTTEFYKGMQKVVNKKDKQILEQQRQLQELQRALAGVVGEVSKAGRATSGQSREMEAMKSILEDMLQDDESKAVFRNRMNQVSKESELDELKQAVTYLAQQVQGQRGSSQSVQEDDEPEEYKIYRSQFLENLREFAKEAGVDPNDKRLDYGDEKESFLERSNRLNKSIKAVKASQDDENIDRARRKVAQPKTRTDPRVDSDKAEYGKSLLEKGTQQMLKKMRKTAFS